MAHLLLVDDNLTTQRVFELALEEEGIELNHFTNAEQALSFAEDNPPDLVFAHVDVPEMGGYELSRQIKSAPETARATVVMLVGAFQVFDSERAAACGCIHSLAKPFETSTLQRLVRDLLENPPNVELPRPKFLFEIPLGRCLTQTVFDLDRSQCAVEPSRLTREVACPHDLDFEHSSRDLEPGFGAGSQPGTGGSDSGFSPPSDAA